MRGWVGVAWGVLLDCAIAGSVQAQPSPPDKALATELFNQARALAAEGKHAEACPKFAESQHLDPGGGTMLNLALCNEALGKTATAWAQFSEALAFAQRDGRPARAKIAKARLAALEPTLMRITVDVTAASDLPGLTIVRDGSPIASSAWGEAMPLDPGEHEITVSAPSYETWSKTVTLGTSGERIVVTVPPLAPLPERPNPEPEIVGPAPAPTPVPPKASAAADAPPLTAPKNARPIYFYIGGGAASALSGASVIVGTVFGVKAMQQKEESDDACIGGCTPTGSRLSEEAGFAADTSTTAFVIGAGTAAAGVVLFVLGAIEQRAAKPSVAISPRASGVAVSW